MGPMTFPDAEAMVVAYLNDRLRASESAVRASTRVPAGDRPGSLVRVVLTGANRLTLAHRDAQVTVECWAPKSVNAAELGETVYGWLSEMNTPHAFVPPGADGWVGGPYSQPDPLTGSPRYVMTAIVRTRGL